MSAVDKIKKEIEKLEKKLENIQNECSHPKSARDEKFGSNTGNYDPTSDCYWIDYHCTLCDKQWTENQ